MNALPRISGVLRSHVSLQNGCRPCIANFTRCISTSATIRSFVTRSIAGIRGGEIFTKRREVAASVFCVAGVAQIQRKFTVSTSVMDLDSETRHYKRKTSPMEGNDTRAAKILKTSPAYANGSASPVDDREGSEYDDNAEMMLDELTQKSTAATADTAEWQATIERVVRNVVSIHFCQTCSFDTDAAVSSEATGFVVDAERGYILTNRHVVGAGPFWGYCIFDNHEEVRF